MIRLSTAIRLGLGSAASVAALVWASASEPGAANAIAPWFVLGAAAASLASLPANLVMRAIDEFADGLEPGLEAILNADRPPTNEDVLREARRAALRGVRVAANRFAASAKANPAEYDVGQAKRLRRLARRWIRQELATAARRDRPASRSWLKPGLSYAAVARAPNCRDVDDKRVAALETDAWQEFVEAMVRARAEVPPGFRSFFAGAPNCGWGWRRAGHLLFMAELKRNHNLFVGFVFDSLARIEETLLEIRDNPARGEEAETTATAVADALARLKGDQPKIPSQESRAARCSRLEKSEED